MIYLQASIWGRQSRCRQSWEKRKAEDTSRIEQKPWEFSSIFKPFTTPY